MYELGMAVIAQAKKVTELVGDGVVHILTGLHRTPRTTIFDPPNGDPLLHK